MSMSVKIDYIDSKTQHELHWPISILKKPQNDREYHKLEKILDTLIDEVKGHENHPLSTLMQIIGDNLEQYDDENNPPLGSNIDAITLVKYLMDSHNLRQIDLADIFGSQANVSKFLNGERSLSKKQILGLKKHFGISADIFLKTEL